MKEKPVVFSKSQVEEIEICLDELARNTRAQETLLAEITERLISARGRLGESDTTATGVAALSAGGYAATVEMARYFEKRPSSGKSLMRVREMNHAGDFKAAVLSTTEGLSPASAPVGYEDEMAAAMVALLNEVARQAHRKLNLAQVDELSLVGDDRTRLACRYFSVDGQDLTLAVLVPSNRYYRRLTNKAIRKVRRACLGRKSGRFLEGRRGVMLSDWKAKGV